MEKFNIAVIGVAAQETYPRGRKLSGHYFSAQAFTKAQDPKALINGATVVLVEAGQGRESMGNALMALAMLRDCSTSPVLYVCQDEPQENIAAQLKADGMFYVTGEYNLSWLRWKKLLGPKGGVGDALRHSRFLLNPHASMENLPSFPMEIVKKRGKIVGGKIAVASTTVELKDTHIKLLPLLSGGYVCGRDYIFDVLSRRDSAFKNNPQNYRPASKNIDREFCELNQAFHAAGAPLVQVRQDVGRYWPARLQGTCIPA